MGIERRGVSVLVAAADTTGNAMTVVAFNVLNDQAIYGKRRWASTMGCTTTRCNFRRLFLPLGTVVGMSSWLMHRDPTIFHNPMQFGPERWLQTPEEFRRLDHNMVPFGRGTRQCVGMRLPYCEICVTLGTLFRQFSKGLQVWKTTPETMTDYEDFFSS
jgi:hypothetical protein